MKERVDVGLLVPGDLLVQRQGTLAKPSLIRLGQRATMFLPILLDLFNGVAEVGRDDVPLFLGQHRDRRLTTPTVERARHAEVANE